MTEPLGLKITCLVCGALLKVWEEIEYNDVADGEIYKDAVVEYECPKGCLYSDEQIKNIDDEIEKAMLGV
jgi:hypothetical protein